MAIADRIPEWVSEYVGMPYVAGGRDRDGADCFGLCLIVWRERFGLDVPAYGGIAWGVDDSPDVGPIIEDQVRAGWAEIPQGEELPGDGILIRMRGHPIHIGVVVAPGLMLHCHDTADAAVEDYTAIQWKRRIIGFYRYRHHA